MFDSSSEMEVKRLQIFKILCLICQKGEKEKKINLEVNLITQHDSNKYLNLEVKRVHLVDLA